MAEEKKNAAEVQEDTEKEISENETVTEAQDDSPEATAGENTAPEPLSPEMQVPPSNEAPHAQPSAVRSVRRCRALRPHGPLRSF